MSIYGYMSESEAATLRLQKICQTVVRDADLKIDIFLDFLD